MPWTENVRLRDDNGGKPKKSKVKPTLDGSDRLRGLVMVRLGSSSNRIYWSMLSLGQNHWTSDRQIGVLQSEYSPSMANYLMLFSDPGPGRVLKASFTAGGWAYDENNRELTNAEGQRFGSGVLPGMAFSGGIFHLIFRASRGDLSYFVIRKGFSEYVEVAGNAEQGLFKTRAQPAVALIDDVLHVVYLGNDSNQIWHARARISLDDQNRITTQWVQKKSRWELSKAPPAVAVFNDRLHMVHIGDTSRDFRTRLHAGS